MNDSISASAWALRREQAQVLLNSGFLPEVYQRVEQVLAIMMYGDVLGIPPMAALNGISVIRNKPTITPQLMLALARHAGVLEDIQVTDDGHKCTVVLKRVGQIAHTTTFSEADAMAMELAIKNNWKKQPAVMRQWRAVAAACRIVFPDLIMGFCTPEEMGADATMSAEGEMMYSEPIAVDPNAESKRIATEWAARWKADGVTGVDMQAALGVKRLGEFDWKADGAVAKADGLMEAYFERTEDIGAIEGAIDNEPQGNTEDAETIDDAPVPETAAEAPKKVLTDSEIAKPWAAEWYDRGSSFEDILAALKIDRLGKFDWKADGAIAKADGLMEAYKAAKAEAKKPSAPIGKAKTAAPGIGDSSAEPPDAENELDKAIACLPKYDKNTDASRL